MELTELPPLNPTVNPETMKHNIIQNQIKYNEAKNLQNDINTKINIANNRNLESIRNKSSYISSIIESINPQIFNRKQQESSLNDEMNILKYKVEKVNSDMQQVRATSDLCQIKLDLNILQKANKKFQDFNADISIISKRVEAAKTKCYKNEQKIREKIKKMQVSLDFKQAEMARPNITKVHKRVDRLSSFIQSTQLDFMLKYMQFYAQLANSSNEFNEVFQRYENDVKKKIQYYHQQIKVEKANILNLQKNSTYLDDNNKDLSISMKESEDNYKNLKIQIEDRLTTIEKMLQLLINSIGEEKSLKSIEKESMDEIKKLANDWELFHQNNYTVQNQVYDIIDYFDEKTSSKGTFLSRLESAENLVNYCSKRISVWKAEEEERMALLGNDEKLIKKMHELEEKVRIAEEKIQKIDGKKIKNISSNGKLDDFNLSIPPPPVPPKKDLKPFYIEDNFVLTYNQELYKGDNNLNFEGEPLKPSYISVSQNSEKTRDINPVKQNEEEEIEEEEEEVEEEEKKNDELKKENPNNSTCTSELSPNLMNMFKIKRRQKRYSNRCYIPFNPIKRGDHRF